MAKWKMTKRQMVSVPIGKAKIPVINKCAADCDLTVTGDQTSKCSEKQYKYEEKICGWQPTVASMLE